MYEPEQPEAVSIFNPMEGTIANTKIMGRFMKPLAMWTWSGHGLTLTDRTFSPWSLASSPLPFPILSRCRVPD